MASNLNPIPEYLGGELFRTEAMLEGAQKKMNDATPEAFIKYGEKTYIVNNEKLNTDKAAEKVRTMLDDRKLLLKKMGEFMTATADFKNDEKVVKIMHKFAELGLTYNKQIKMYQKIIKELNKEV